MTGRHARPIMHVAEPGPWPTWDMRCTRCGEPVSLHATLWHRFLYALLGDARAEG